MYLVNNVTAIGWTTSTLLWIFLIIIIFGLSYFALSIRQEEKKVRHVPGPPKSNYLFGHALDVKEAMESDNMMIQDLLNKWAQRYGPTFKVFMLHKAVIVTAHPMGIKEALLGGHPKAEELYKRLVTLYGVRFLGTGLVTLTDNTSWRHRRKAMEPAFKRRFLKGLMQQFNKTSDEFICKLHRYSGGQIFVPMADEFRRCTLDLIGKVAFGMNIDSINNENNQFSAAIDTILAAMYTQLFKGDFGINPWKRAFYRKSREAITFLRNVCKDLIHNREVAMRLGHDVPQDVLTHSIKTAACEGAGLDTESIIDDFINFFIAGHETTANTLSFTIMELGRHADVLQRLREELAAVIGDEDYLTYDHIHRLKYMDMVIRESMRLYPTAPSTFRKLNRTCDIGGYTIPAETIVMVSNFVATRNPEVFEHPLDFIPERFDPRSSKKISVYNSIPFSLGPRSCLGKTFATIQTKVILSKFLLRFDFNLDMNQSFEMIEVATLKPKSAVNCLLYERNRSDMAAAARQ